VRCSRARAAAAAEAAAWAEAELEERSREGESEGASQVVRMRSMRRWKPFCQRRAGMLYLTGRE
jgi:hypothetical protein